MRPRRTQASLIRRAWPRDRRPRARPRRATRQRTAQRLALLAPASLSSKRRACPSTAGFVVLILRLSYTLSVNCQQFSARENTPCDRLSGLPDQMTEPSTGLLAPSPLELVQEHSLTSALKLELERMIFDGSVRVGERLNESTLAAHFGTSRGPLREALQALGEQGLVSFTRNRGAFVRQISVVEADELYDLRSALDDEVGRKLAGALTKTQSNELRSLLRVMDNEAKRNDIRHYYPSNLRFHDLLV